MSQKLSFKRYHLFLKIPVVYLREIRREILKFGSSGEVFPKELRNYIKEKIKKISIVYR